MLFFTRYQRFSIKIEFFPEEVVRRRSTANVIADCGMPFVRYVLSVHAVQGVVPLT